MTVYVLLAFISLFSSFVQTTIGFGYGMVAVVFLPVLFGSNADSASVITIVGIVQAVVLFGRCWREVRWRVLLPLLLAFFVVMPMATYCSRFLPLELLALLLGIVLILIAVYFLFLKGKLQLKPTRSSAAAAGVLSGALAGFFAVPGIPASIYLINVSDRKEEYYANMQAFLVACGLYSITIRTVQNMVSAQSLLYALVAALIVPLGSRIGRRVYQKISQERLKLFVYYFIGFSGIVKIIEFFSSK